MKEIVTIKNKEAVVDSRDLSKEFNLEHRSTRRLIETYIDIFNKMGFHGFEIQRTKNGREERFCFLDEKQATFLISLMKNSEIVVDFKAHLIEQFFRQRQMIAQLVTQKENPNWLNVRKDGKVVVKQKSVVIDDFIKYALDNGASSGAKWYHANYAKMENQAMFIFEQKYPNMREVLTIKQMMQVATGDDIIEKAIKEGMEKEMYYKDIFKEAKKRIIKYVEIIGKSPILGLEEK